MSRPESTEAFLASVRAQIRVKKAREEITRELATHLEEQRDAYIREGLTGEAATVKAVEQMGDPVSIGGQLDRLHRPRPDWAALALVALLTLAGGGFIQLLSNRPHFFLSVAFAHYLVYVAVGIAVLAAVYFTDYSILGRYPMRIYAGIVLIGMLFLAVFQVRANNSFRWDYYWAIALVPAFAGVICSQRGKGYAGLAICGALFLPPALVCLVSGLVNSFLCLTVLCALLLTAAVVKGWFKVNKPLALVLIFAPLLCAAGLAFLTSPQLRERLLYLFSPSLDPRGIGYQSEAIRLWLSRAHLIGAADQTGIGPGGLSVLDLTLPALNTDCALTYLIARSGWAAGIAVLLPLGLLLWRMFAAVRRQKSSLGFMVSLSAALAVALQTLLYILYNLGFTFVSLTLPLLSYGGVGFAVNMALIGLMLSAFRSRSWMSDRVVRGVRTRRRLRISLKWETI